MQIGFNHQVLEQNRKFYFIASATLGVNLETGEELLDLEYLKDAFKGMGDNPLPDMGMPKPNGEFLVSGSFYSRGKKSVTGGEVKIRLDGNEKSLYVFGTRTWKAGIPSKPDEITTMPLDYTRAFGGERFEKNPEGIGFNDGLLPCVENPKHLVVSTSDKPEPAGFSPLPPNHPQRMQYQGTYDADYKRKFFPGYPDDHNWKSFLCAPPDQWIKSYYKGDENFGLYNMHPDLPNIEGCLPGLSARCFINQIKDGNDIFGELPLNLDTIWFFPDRLLGLLIFRGITQADDDEAETIHHILCAYEAKAQQPRTLDYYRKAFEMRKNSDDDLLFNLNTQDLIPEGHKSAMELLMEMGPIETDGEDSPLINNMAAKAKAIQKEADEKIEEAIQYVEKKVKGNDVPDAGKIDIRKIVKEPPDAPPDREIEEMNRELDAILPGLSADGAQKIEMKNFSFDKLDQIIEIIKKYSDKKINFSNESVNKELGKTREQLKKQIEKINKHIEELTLTTGQESSAQINSLENSKKKVSDILKNLDDIDLNVTSKEKTALPRLDVNMLNSQMTQADLKVMEAIHHLQSMKEMRVDDEKIKDMEKQIQEQIKNNKKQLEDIMQEAETGFKAGYLASAHFMDEGLSPHEDPLEDIKKRFLEAASKGEDLSGMDWACIDLSGVNLDGIDLSGAYLEQVDLTAASLKGANLSHSIMARAILDDADFTGANMAGANIGAVHAHETIFVDANLKSAKLSKGDFTGSIFSGADLEEIESLEMVINHATFSQSNMPKINFIETTFQRTNFTNSKMSNSVFVKCHIADSDFTGCTINNSAFVDNKFDRACFNKADLSSTCFVSTKPENCTMEDINFKDADLTQTNFQNMVMKKANLTNTRMENAFFGGTDLSDADLSFARAKNAQFRKATLTGAKLDKIDLDQGSLAKAHLVGTSFIGANLHAVDFLRSTIKDTDFTGSNLDTTLIEHWRPK